MSILQKLIPNAFKIRYFYVLPIRTGRDASKATEVIRRAAWHHQAWYQWRMTNSKTVSLYDPVVEVIRSEHVADWFNENQNGQQNSWFCNNARLEVVGFAGRHNPRDVWMIYVDAQPAEGQKMGGTLNGDLGSAVMGAEDVDGLWGIHPHRTLCRQIGGDAHELGHALGLHHPASQDPQALMWTGYTIYPQCILLQPDLGTLNASPFLAESWGKKAPAGLCSFNQRPEPSPRPRPVIGPRP